MASGRWTKGKRALTQKTCELQRWLEGSPGRAEVCQTMPRRAKSSRVSSRISE